MGFSIVKNGGTFRLRVYVPQELQSVLGRKELKKTLKTTKRSEASALASALMFKTNTAFLRIQTGMLTPGQLKQITANILEEFGRRTEHHRAELKGSSNFLENIPLGLDPNFGDMELIDVAYAKRKSPEDIALAVAGYETRIGFLEREKSTLNFSDETYLLVQQVIERNNLRIDMPSPAWFDPNDDERFKEPPDDFLKVCVAVVSGLIDAFSLEVTKLQGKRDRVLEADIQARIEAAKKTLTLSELWEAYRDEKVTLGDWGGDGRTEAGYTAKFKEAVSIIGDKELSQYDNDSALTFIKALQKKNKPGTIIIKTEFLSSLFKWAMKKKGHTANPFADNQVADDVDAEDKKKSYTTEDIHCILNGLLTVRKMIEPHRFWVPLVALYTGMRQGEICQLRIDDISAEDSIPVFMIRHRPEYKQLVKKKDIRTCPIHPMLIKLGFMEYVDNLRCKGVDRVFPTLTYSRGKAWTGKIRTWYNETFQTKWVVDTEKKSFHSFRGTLTNQFKQDMLYDRASDRAVVQSMIGHDGVGDVTDVHYEDKFTLTTKYAMLKKLDYRIDPDLIAKLKAKEL